MLMAALGAEAAAIAIPLLTKSIIDGAITHHDKRLLLPLGLAAAGLGIAEAALSLIRRWVQGSAVAGMEKTLRDDLYAHLQNLEPAFHDGWQSGQLLSRATSDLSSIRRFAGFGLVFLIITVTTFTAVAVLLIRLNWWMGLAASCMVAPVVVFCLRFERRYKILARRVQDQEGDLATLIEEGATGVRVLKALGRAPEAAATHAAQATQMYTTKVSMASTTCPEARFNVGLSLTPVSIERGPRGSTGPGSTGLNSADRGSADRGSADRGSADRDSAGPGSAEDGSTDLEPIGPGPCSLGDDGGTLIIAETSTSSAFRQLHSPRP